VKSEFESYCLSSENGTDLVMDIVLCFCMTGFGSIFHAFALYPFMWYICFIR
jgi:hypothetical protein